MSHHPHRLGPALQLRYDISEQVIHEISCDGFYVINFS